MLGTFDTKNTTKVKYDKKDMRTCYIMLAVPLLGFLIFTLYPIIWAGKISFYSYTGVPSETKFIGLANYIKLIFEDSGYWKSWLVNLQFALIKVPIEMLLAFIIADILMNNTRLAGFYRSMYFLPSIISVAIVGLVFSNLFDFFGVVNVILERIGIIGEPVSWFSKRGTSMFALIAAALWQTLGNSVLYFTAAISTVPKDVYESAEIDGAGKLTVLFKITLPLIAPVLQVVMLLSLTGVLHVNDFVLVMTNGAPGGTTYTVSAYLTSKIVAGYGELANVGHAAAMSVVTSIIMCIIGVYFSKLTNRLKNIY